MMSLVGLLSRQPAEAPAQQLAGTEAAEQPVGTEARKRTAEEDGHSVARAKVTPKFVQMTLFGEPASERIMSAETEARNDCARLQVELEDPERLRQHMELLVATGAVRVDVAQERAEKDCEHDEKDGEQDDEAGESETAEQDDETGEDDTAKQDDDAGAKSAFSDLFGAAFGGNCAISEEAPTSSAPAAAAPASSAPAAAPSQPGAVQEIVVEPVVEEAKPAAVNDSRGDYVAAGESPPSPASTATPAPKGVGKSLCVFRFSGLFGAPKTP
jgi:hypothetical protein